MLRRENGVRPWDFRCPSTNAAGKVKRNVVTGLKLFATAVAIQFCGAIILRHNEIDFPVAIIIRRGTAPLLAEYLNPTIAR